MATASYVVGTTSSAGAAGTYFIAPNAPASNICLFDVYDASLGYGRIVLTTGGLLRHQYSYVGFTGDVELSGVNTVLTYNTWTWVSLSCCIESTNHVLGVSWAIRTDGSTHGSQVATVTSLGPIATWAARFGLGHANSTGTLADFPTTAGWGISKAIIIGSGQNAPIGAPSADWGSTAQPISIAAGQGGYYNCRGGVGPVSTLTDDSGNGFHLAGSFVRGAAGPFAA